MCLAIPQQVVKIKGRRALVKSDSHFHQVDLSLLKNVKVGDFLLAHQELAIGKISKSNARKILKMISEQRKRCKGRKPGPASPATARVF